MAANNSGDIGGSTISELPTDMIAVIWLAKLE